MHAFQTITIIATVAIFVSGCGRPTTSAPGFPITAAPITNWGPTLSLSEVVERFRGRATATEIDEFERLTRETNPDNRTLAMQLVLHRLSQEELSQVGISEVAGQKGERWWAFASCRGFSDTNGAVKFEQTMHDAGVTNWFIHSHGYFGYYTPRDQYFKALRVVQQTTNLQAIELRVFEPPFTIQ